MQWDIIGDVHGHAEPLERLLANLGYEEQNGVYQHPDNRRVLFLGDLIDRGPAISRVIEIARNMHQAGHAKVILGNHEVNFLGMMTQGPNGTYARAHTAKRMKDFTFTRNALGEQVNEVCEWFRHLPFFFDEDGFRAVHAAWDKWELELIDVARGGHNQRMSDAFIVNVFEEPVPYPEPGDLFRSVERVLKGFEVDLPDNVSFIDFSGHERFAARVQWYRQPTAGDTFASWAMPPGSISCAEPAGDYDHYVPGYPDDAPPCFVGHYWLSGAPSLLAPNVACLDYGVARGPEKGGDQPGQLVAYRYDGEQILDSRKLVAVLADPQAATLSPSL